MERLIDFSPDCSKEFIFVSYSSQDADWVYPVVNRLLRMGFNLWLDKCLDPGANWFHAIRRKVDDCARFLLFLSDKAVSSHYVQVEIAYALAGEARNPSRTGEAPSRILTVARDATTLRAVSASDLQELNSVGAVHGISCDDLAFGSPSDFDQVAHRIARRLGSKARHSKYYMDVAALGLGFRHDGLYAEAGGPAPSGLDLEERIVSRLETTRPPGIDVDDVFQLTSTRYGRERLEQMTNPAACSSRGPQRYLHHPLRIHRAYVAPMMLVDGLITDVEAGWPPFVAAFERLASQHGPGSLDETHYFTGFCWLAWGPSVSTESLADSTADSGRATDRRFMVLQTAFGDESNSVPLIIPMRAWPYVRDDLLRGFSSGRAMALDGVQVVKPFRDPWFASLTTNPLAAEMFHGNSDAIALYLACPGDRPRETWGFAPLNGGQAGAFYSTAYVWLILEQIGREKVGNTVAIKADNALPMAPGKVLPFFEHTNLASARCLDFLQHCLARKAIHHVIACGRPDASPSHREEGFYRFSTSLLARDMHRIMLEEIDALPPVQRTIVDQRLFVPDDPAIWRTHVDVLHYAAGLRREIGQTDE